MRATLNLNGIKYGIVRQCDFQQEVRRDHQQRSELIINTCREDFSEEAF